LRRGYSISLRREGGHHQQNALSSEPKTRSKTYAKEGVLAGIKKAIEMNPQEYVRYFEDFIFIADTESG
jgi:hypothetical protein